MLLTTLKVFLDALVSHCSNKTTSVITNGAAGAPSTKIHEAIKDEHCTMAGCEVEFTTSNYGVTTTPNREYDISTGVLECPEKDMVDKKGRRVRTIVSLEDLKKLELCQSAKLTDDEITSVVSRQNPHPSCNIGTKR